MSTDGPISTSSLANLPAPTGAGSSRRMSADTRPGPAVGSQRSQESKASAVDKSLEERIVAMVNSAVQQQLAGATRDLQEFKALSSSSASSSVSAPTTWLRSALRARFSGTSPASSLLSK